MKRTILRNKWFGGAVSAFAVAGLWAGGAALLRPRPAKAFTLVELSAFVFPEVTLTRGTSLLVCTNNLLGDGSVRGLVGLLDVSDSTHFVPGTQQVPVALDPQKGGCAALLPAVQTTAATLTAPPPTTGIPVLFITGGSNGNGNSAGGGGGGAGKGLVTSAQLMNSTDGAVIAIISPAPVNGLLLPAVQTP